MENDYKFVEFDKYCKTCKHFESDPGYDPCDTCLANTENLYSHKPVNYEEDKTKS